MFRILAPPGWDWRYYELHLGIERVWVLGRVGEFSVPHDACPLVPPFWYITKEAAECTEPSALLLLLQEFCKRAEAAESRSKPQERELSVDRPQ